MDIVLEGFDTYLFDYAFAQLFPTNPSLNALKSNASATFSSMREEPAARYNNYQFKRSSNYIQFPPGPNAWLTSWPRDDPIRQGISLYIITALFGILIYFIFAGLSYVFVFDKNTFKHPKYLKNQVSLEIKQALLSIPLMAIFTAPLFWLEVRGYGKMYDTTEEGPGLWYNYFQFPLFLLFTDFGIYWIHRGLHHPVVYKHLHKPHHKWIMPTPFASHAFHPVDGFAQSIPYHAFPFVFPLQKFAYVGLFVFINVWTVMIHDGEYVANSPVINGAACHTLHHLYFNYNYGQYTTISDRIFGSYRKPNMELFHRETKMSEDEWRRQQKEMENIVKEVEDKDDRVYLNEANGKKTQ